MAKKSVTPSDMANLMVNHCIDNCNQWIASDEGIICLRVKYGKGTPQGCPISLKPKKVRFNLLQKIKRWLKVLNNCLFTES